MKCPEHGEVEPKYNECTCDFNWCDCPENDVPVCPVCGKELSDG
jgi:hypothetical protein